MNNPKITVVTVCYNAAKTLEKTIQSVINQTYNNIEYIIIDGASTDGTLEIIKKYEDRISYWQSEPDEGIYDAMNKGIKAATGEWINFMNSGDSFYSNDVLEKLVPQVDDDSVIVYGDVNLIFQSDELKIKPYRLDFLKEHGMCFCHQSCFVKTSYHKEHLFDISFKIVADYNLFYNAYYGDGVNFQYIPGIVSDFDADGGISATDILLVEHEKARVQGIDGSVKWKLKYYIFLRVKQLIKTLVPKRLLDARKQRKLKEMQRQCVA
jgi:glycosyltransferase involved in cell wall biosynthesis